MTELYKLLFDTALYYTLSGFYAVLAFSVYPEPLGFLALAAAAVGDALLRRRGTPHRAAQAALLLLPLCAVLIRPDIRAVIQLLPAWAYVGWSMFSGRIFTDYDAFKEHFAFALKLLLLLLPGLFFRGGAAAFVTAVPYLSLMLACGICLLRTLREETPSGVRQGVYIGAFLLICAGLTIGNAPRLFARAAAFLYQNVLAPLAIGAAMALAVAVFAVFQLLDWLASLLRGEPEPLEIEMESAAEILGLEEQYERYTANLSWLRTVLIVLAVLTAALVLLLIFRRLLGSGQSEEARSPYLERREKLTRPPEHSRSPGRIRPRSPRLAVRFYYAKFLAECRRRGLEPEAGMTSAELAGKSAAVFPEADPAALTALYAPARYSGCAPVSAADAERAEYAWRELKRSRMPERSDTKTGRNRMG